ncbi:MAG TPA: hypothetical protein DHU63_05110 [Candidatus Marinimicrobia bacterium]|nr:MAG: hypothetical protein AUJ47_05530 [Candidatus Marinimicrobia bacterium CG1_02_48_14]PIZ67279.1 MAG: hypothetical protein COY19_05655 [Candidatus Marinimicrobia bacterium CG_4_10_14_0_2_um_filter_48_9]PJA52163.1 MAG: hypothetical protein CO167_10015 [Candidatus Marinimicrobia bacterium CG_4_9_14_3_um_filter_48_9]HCW75902.1 hypothetical protein [Candidatus Neomarinimicrobiota bacterium]
MNHQNEQARTETGGALRFIIKGPLDQLFNRLSKGMVISGRIVRRLTPTKCILRIYGYNMVAYSNLSLENRKEVSVLVQEIDPVPIFKIIETPVKQ